MKRCFNQDIDMRLASVEGHVKGVRQMVADDKDCADVLLQLSAIEAAVKKVSKIVLKNHLEHCVREGVEKGDMRVIDRLSEVLDTYK
jgi:Uncharacterized protein conserved in bacteria